ncbi:hypothetical protein WMY93_001814 [Mugilogobius chulae]|uniref:Uncharacterized protein n=1 Tax=Mugilogobius chulae TaxID=88201 RepID=A0AAW0PT36_9GOBI
MKKWNKAYPDNALGLLRFIRNLCVHHCEDAEKMNIAEMFPNLFGSIYKFAKKLKWNLDTPLKEMFQREERGNVKSSSEEEKLIVPVQETQNNDMTQGTVILQ